MDVIGELLRASLLGELGDDQERAAKVRDAAGDLADRLTGAGRPLVPGMVLAAVDPDTAAGSTELTAVADAVLGRWETFRNAFPGRPAELLRAVAFAAVVTAADRTPAVRNAAWYALRTALEEGSTGPWAELVQRLYMSWDEAARADMAALWSPPAAALTLRMPNVTAPASVQLNRDALLGRANATVAGNYNTFSQTLHGEFVAYVADLITATETTATHAGTLSHVQLKDFANALGQRMRETLGAYEGSLRASMLRSDLLWWRHTGFSDRLGERYVAMGEPALVALGAALDLHDQVPPVAPLVVEHLLHDMVEESAGAAAVALADLRAAAPRAGLTPAAVAPSLSLLDALTDPTGTTPLLDAAASRPAARIAVLVFRDLQARRLAVVPAPAPGEAADPAGA